LTDPRPERILGLLGRNGAGKTTTINILNSFLTPTAGRCLLFGENAHDLSPVTKARIGYLGFHLTSRNRLAWGINLGLAVGLAAWWHGCRRPLGPHLPELAAVVVGGLLGLVVVACLPRTG